MTSTRAAEPREAKALQHLDPDQALPMRALASRLHANPSNVTVIVARLEARLLQDHPADGWLGVRLAPDRHTCRLPGAGVAHRLRSLDA